MVEDREVARVRISEPGDTVVVTVADRGVVRVFLDAEDRVVAVIENLEGAHVISTWATPAELSQTMTPNQ